MRPFLFAIFVTMLYPASLLAEESVVAKLEKCDILFEAQRPEAVSACQEVAELGNPKAQRILGDMYYWGWGDALQKDPKKSVMWYKRAATAGNVNARYNLGYLYEQGLGVPVDFKRSYQWYRSAAERGHADAQFNLGNMFNKGAGVEKNEAEAVTWYKRAAKQGIVEAQFNLANKYVRGNGVSQNAIEAYKWYQVAAQNGMDEARKNLNLIAAKMTTEQIAKGRDAANNFSVTKEEMNEER